ncbi:MAG: Stk1 family PASTA domain-containing Ser/Thr kinase [Clostridiaceae bacterium]|nr:Stk1 family PASTA domain-containing Ser/Thr kinase [Clostridiaceae bacterium]
MKGKLLLNRYELLEKIGEGGMGVVYKAKCHLLNRFVAIKLLKAELGNDEDFVASFKMEANAVASLSHSNIVNIYDVGSENNTNFIVMEYIKGKTLKLVIKENVRLSSERTLDIAFQIAKALECAHKNNIIHRDIKPDNIMITKDNIVKVMDFGIAKVTDSQTVTNSNKVTGSVHYFSPEQAKGKFVDSRTDIYSLGIVMYEMITGQVPFNAENSISIAIMHIQKPAIPPKEIIIDMPENINQAILKALEKEPINRYETAKEMVEVLNSIKEDLNFKVNFNKRSLDATTIMMMPQIVVSETRNDFKTAMSDVASTEIPINKGIHMNKKIMIIMGSIILAIVIGFSAKYLYKDPSTDTAKTSPTKASVQVPVDEKKIVPSLIGSTEDNAKKTIVNNEFLVGNISYDFSASIAKGLVISQTPLINTSYEKNGVMDLVISQGEEVEQVTDPELKGKGNGKKAGKR